MSTEAKNQVETILADKAIHCDISYVCQTVKDKWKCLKWKVEIGDQEFDFYTGMAWVGEAPHIADVLYAVISDMDAIDMNFRDWCDYCGFNNDSIKDLGTYSACIENGIKLKKVFHPEDVERLKEVLEDY